MLSFHSLSISDKDWIDRLTIHENSRSADYNFGNMFLWDEKYQQLVAEWEQHLVVLCRNEEYPFFPFPIGNTNLDLVIPEMKQYANAHGFPLVLRGLEAKHRALLESTFPDMFSFKEDRDYADYLYDVDKLISLEGKKYHGKRNHISHFTSSNNWNFRALTNNDFSECRLLTQYWAENKKEGVSNDSYEETQALERSFLHFEDLDLMGGALFVEDQLVAFTIGEKLSDDTFDIHFEKAHADIDGAYPMINREFARMIRVRFPEIRYINREDDMGQENLRKSKLSYYPEIILMKYSAYLESEV